MSEPQQPGKERPARPPKPTLKPQRTAPTLDHLGAPTNSPGKTQNHVKPPAPPKPKKQPSLNHVNSSSDNSTGGQVITPPAAAEDLDRSGGNRETGSPTGSPKVPPRRHKTPKPKPNQPVEEAAPGKAEVNGGSDETDSPQTAETVEQDYVEGLVKDPDQLPSKKLLKQEPVEEELNSGSEVSVEKLENGGVDHGLDETPVDEASSLGVDSSSDADAPKTNIPGGDSPSGKKIPLKPKPSRPPPPTKRPSVLSREESLDTREVKNLQVSSSIKPKPPKPHKPSLAVKGKPTLSAVAKVPSEAEEKETESAPRTEEDGGSSLASSKSDTPVSTNEPSLPLRRKHTLDVADSGDQKSMENNHTGMTETKQTEADNRDGNVSAPKHKKKPKRPIPPPTKAKTSNTHTKIVSNGRAVTPTTPTSPPISKNEKRLSNGTMFAVYGSANTDGVEEQSPQEEPLTKVESQVVSRKPPAIEEGAIKPHRPAPKKPPPPNQVLLKSKSLKAKSSPSSSPVHGKMSKEGGSPQRQASLRPAGPPPPPPPGGKKVLPDKGGSVKTPPKRPPPVHRKPLTKGTPVKEDPVKEEPVKDEEADRIDHEDKEPSVTLNDSSSPGDNSGLAEPEEESKHNGPDDPGQDSPTTIVVVDQEESGVTTPTGGAPEGLDNVFVEGDQPSEEAVVEDQDRRDSSHLSVQESTQESFEDDDSYDDSFDDDDDGASSRSGDREEAEAAATSDAAFMESLPKMQRKAYQVAKEIRDSEFVFVDVLRLLNEDFKTSMEYALRADTESEIDKSVMDQILGFLPQLQLFNEELHSDLTKRIDNWAENPKVADVFIKKGPFLKLFTTYIQNFQKQTAALDDACNRWPLFKESVKKFQASKRCQNLHISHYMLKPVQRIPQYRMLLTDYQKNLEPGSVDEEDTIEAVAIVSIIASHVNEGMKSGETFDKLLNIQHSLIGQRDIVKPGRSFIKEGMLHKLSRKEFQQRKLFLLSDVLLITSSTPAGLKLNYEHPLAELSVAEPKQKKDHENEFEVYTKKKSFTLAASSQEEKDEWMTAISDAVKAVKNKQKTFIIGEEGAAEEEKEEFVLGSLAPVWIPDKRVTMCMLCTANFTLTFRKHHCRACGKVVCNDCSPHKVYLKYLDDKDRACVECYKTLGDPTPDPKLVKRKKSHINSPKPSGVLAEVKATDDNSLMKGYLEQKEKRNKYNRIWCIIKDNALYTYRASEDPKATSSHPLPGYEVKSKKNEITLTQKSIELIFKTDSEESCEQWTEAFKKATNIF